MCFASCGEISSSFWHTIVIYIPVALYFGINPGPIALLAIPGLLLVWINQCWVALALAVVGTRYRDVVQMITTIVQITMFATPIMYPISALGNAAIIAYVNPLYHVIDVARAPMLGTNPCTDLVDRIDHAWQWLGGRSPSYCFAGRRSVLYFGFDRTEEQIVVAISLKNVSVDIPIYDVGGASLRKAILGRTVGGRFATAGSVVTVSALKDITFDAHDGDRVALVGNNGSGKSTLLRVLADVYPPTNGTVDVVGRVSPMFDATLGMSMDATGMENIWLCGRLWGLSPAQIKRSTDDICDFTELGDYLNVPIRTYSTGMMLRLAFAIATVREPEVFLLDEIIGVGDAAFFQKAFDRLKNVISRSRILFVASHADGILRLLCNKALWLDHGTLIKYGDFEDVIASYRAENKAPQNEEAAKLAAKAQLV